MKAPIHPIIITVLIFSCTGNVNANTLFNDTTRTTKPWKISEHQFLDQYGKDDTSRAIINYYFKQYNGGHKHLFVNTAIASAGIALFAIIMANGADAGAIIVGAPFIFGGVIFGMLAFRNAINMIYFSRKKLFKVLKKYFESKKISDSLRKDIYRKKR
ncbi:MAG TPA: hypothetical protein VFU29_13370 [Chitinophagaceae bacterium]|nr:hypothetical protein [Chitinophagaceae bacterium]